MDGFFANGRLDGENIAYYTDGTIRHRFQYKEGSRTGSNLEYHPNGQIKSKEQVALNGIDVTEEGYDDTGKAVYEKHFRQLKPRGIWIFYGADGKTLKLKETYENGKLHGLRTQYFPNGEKQTEEMYQYNLITGPVKNFYDTGKPESVAEYRANRPHGLFISYYPNGKLKEEGEYVAGKKHKEWKEYDEQGNLMKTYVFKAGILAEEK